MQSSPTIASPKSISAKVTGRIMSDFPLLSISGLRCGYGGKPVLQGIDLSIREGEITAVIGRNGVGKSTLIKAIIGLLPPSAGSIRLRGREVGTMTAHARARLGLGYVPQGRDVFPRMSVEENLRVGESIGGDVTGSFDSVYGYFPILRERRRQAAGTLSGGQQQQLAIARVLVGKPSLVLLDEPSEGIQPSIVQDIARIGVELNHKTGLTIVLVEQNIDMIRAMAQRCYVMDKGRVVAELTPEMLEDRDIVRRYLAV
jgi:urea transport system ATP-binding protein